MQQCLISIQLIKKKNLKPAIVQVLPQISNASKSRVVLSSSHTRRTDCKSYPLASCLLPRPYPSFPLEPHWSLDLRPVAYAVFSFNMLSFPKIFYPFIQTPGSRILPFHSSSWLSKGSSFANFPIVILICLLHCTCFIVLYLRDLSPL